MSTASVLEEPLTAAASRVADSRWLRAAETGFVKWQFLTPGWHRVRVAAGLSAGLFGGRMAMNVISGIRPDGTEVQREDVLAPFRPLRGLMHYNAYSDDPKERWKHIVDTVAPGIAGAMGVIAASHYHFGDRMQAAHLAEDIMHGAEGMATREQVEQAISMNHARAMERPMAVSSLKGASSGSHLTPFGFGPILSAGVFAPRSDRAIGSWMGRLSKTLFGTSANTPFRNAGNMSEMWKHLLSNPGEAVHELPELSEYAKGVTFGSLKTTDPKIPDLVQQHVYDKAKLIHQYCRTGILPMKDGEPLLSPNISVILTDMARNHEISADGSLKLSKKLLNALSAESWHDIERIAMDHGALDATSAESLRRGLRIGDNGAIGQGAEKIDPQIGKENEAYRDYYAKLSHLRHQGASREQLEAVKVAKPVQKGIRKPRAAFMAAGAATAALAAYGATHSQVDGITPIAASHGGHEQDSQIAGNQPVDRIAHFANNLPLRTAEWVSNSFNFPPSKHRLMNAVGFFAGSGTGMKIGEVLTGLTYGGEKAKLNLLPGFMKPIAGVMDYDFHGADSHNRWMKVAHYAFPFVGGMIGTKMASDVYFRDRKKELEGDKEQTIDRVSEKIAFHQSGPWSYLAGITSAFNVGSGLAVLPFNYGMNLGTRFSLGTDRVVVLPGLKEIWSNNHSKEPYGPAKLLNVVVEYATLCPSREPEILRERCGAILTSWFGQQPPSVVQRFGDDILAVRNKYYQDGGVPKNRQEACRKELKQHFTGLGLHEELARLGLDVLNARVGDNGLSGDIGNFLGARHTVERDLNDFRSKVIERRLKDPKFIPANENAVDGPNMSPANENTTRFTARVAGERQQQQGVAPSV